MQIKTLWDMSILLEGDENDVFIEKSRIFMHNIQNGEGG